MKQAILISSRVPRPARLRHAFACVVSGVILASAVCLASAQAQELPLNEPGGTPGAPADRAGPETPYHQSVETVLPDSPKKRAEVLANLYALLATTGDERTAGEIAGVIERVWTISFSDTTSVLMMRATQALAAKDAELALQLLDAVVELQPDFAEGWSRRAVVLYSQNDYARALGDLRRALALDPSHFRALSGLGQVLQEVGQKKAALEAYRQLEAVYPLSPGLAETLRELERDVEGQGI